ncbi:hypothetical protein D9M68_947880 [compost metagenome]
MLVDERGRQHAGELVEVGEVRGNGARGGRLDGDHELAGIAGGVDLCAGEGFDGAAYLRHAGRMRVHDDAGNMPLVAGWQRLDGDRTSGCGHAEAPVQCRFSLCCSLFLSNFIAPVARCAFSASGGR